MSKQARKKWITTGHTETAHGVIPHVVVNGEVRAPVKLDFRRGTSSRHVGGVYARSALVRNGRFVHALPGGGEVLGGYVG